MDNPQKTASFLAEFARIRGPKVLVHGGGKIATAISAALGIESVMIQGRRVTDAETLKIVTMVYAGWINKHLTAQLNALGCAAWGVCGADGALMPALKRNPVPVDYGFVGDPVASQFNIAAFEEILRQGFVPVFAPITISENGDLLNTNADTVAQTIAVAMSAKYDTELVYCFEKNGVLENVADEQSVIPEITPALYARLKEQGAVADGMIPKLDNAFRAIGQGVKQVFICNSEHLGIKNYGGTKLCDNE